MVAAPAMAACQTGARPHLSGGVLFTILGEVYRKALEVLIVEDLMGLVPAADYPEGGEGWIVRLAP